MRAMRRSSTHAFELAIALLAIAAALSFLRYPEQLAHSPVGQTFHPLDWAWNAAYGAAGVCMVIGVFCGKRRLEAAGLCLLIAGVLLAAIAFFYVVRFSGSVLPSYASFIAVTLACLARLYELIAYPEVLVMKHPPPPSDGPC